VSFDLGKHRITFKCPECGFSNTVTLNQVQNEETIVCSGCHKNIKLNDKDSGTKKAIKDVNASMDELNRNLDKFRS
jgi:transcription elongation factor Elf1